MFQYGQSTLNKNNIRDVQENFMLSWPGRQAQYDWRKHVCKFMQMVEKCQQESMTLPSHPSSVIIYLRYLRQTYQSPFFCPKLTQVRILSLHYTFMHPFFQCWRIRFTILYRIRIHGGKSGSVSGTDQIKYTNWFFHHLSEHLYYPYQYTARSTYNALLIKNEWLFTRIFFATFDYVSTVWYFRNRW